MGPGFIAVLMEFIENEKRLGKEPIVDEFLCKLLNANKLDEAKLRYVLFGIEDLLKNYNKWQVKFGKKLFEKLIEFLKKDQGIPTNLTVNILLCIKQYVDQFPTEPSQVLVAELWNLSSTIDNQPQAYIILGQLFDLFVQHIDNFLYETQLQQVIQQLLSSPDKIKRKTAINLIGRQMISIEKSKDETAEVIIKASGWQDKLTYVHSLYIYMSIWNELDGEVTPSLQNMKNVILLMRTASTNWQTIWIELLYMQLLAQYNLQIKRMTIEHLMAYYNFSDLSSRLRRQFLLATNNVLLYDVLGDFFNRQYIPSFLKNSRVEFLEAFITIDSWDFVHTHFWFSFFLNKKIHPTISYDLLMRIAKCVRRQSFEIRDMMQKIFLCYMFETTIGSLSLQQYIAFMEALYDIDDGFYYIFQFIGLLHINAITDLTPFSKRFYEIYTSRFNTNFKVASYVGHTDQTFDKLLKDVCNRLKVVPKEKHAWLRFVLVFNLVQTDFIIDFCRHCYDLDLPQLKTDILSLTEFHRIITDKLVWNPDEEADYIHSKCVDLYTELQLKKWSDLERLSLDPLELIAMGNLHTYSRLLKLLGEHDAPDVPQYVLDSLLQILHEKYFRRKCICELYVRQIHRYAVKHFSEMERGHLLCKILNLDLEHRFLPVVVIGHLKMSNEFLIRGLLHGDYKHKAKCIREAYQKLMLQTTPVDMVLRHCFKSTKQLHLNTSLFDELLRINNDLSIRIPEYHERSKVHILKIRIAQAIVSIHNLYKWQYWSDALWTALLADFNQRNIRYLYELILVKFAINVEQILVKIRQITEYSGANQLSLLSVVYNYYMINTSTVTDAHLIEIIDLVIPLTMNNNSLVRQYAQVIVYVLVKEIDFKGIEKPIGFDDFQRNARIALGDERLVELLLHPRFKIHEYYKKLPDYANNMILYVTYTPIDECGYWLTRKHFDPEFQKQFDEARITYYREMITRPKTYIAAANDVNLNFGPYAMNPKPIEEILYNTVKN